ncbi:MAG: hypothetical protein ACPIOQ_26125 [Promethearchaeia archaeon]
MMAALAACFQTNAEAPWRPCGPPTLTAIQTKAAASTVQSLRPHLVGHRFFSLYPGGIGVAG